MQQVVQDLREGVVKLLEVPVPVAGPGMLLIRTTTSLVSAGTERMLVDFGRAGWLERARQQPDRVRQVFDKMLSDGVLTTLDAVRRKLDQPMPLGYSNVGRVVAVGTDTPGFSVDERVVSNGPHAGFVCVPKNLCAVVPTGVDDVTASFAVIGAIALQGVRLLEPTLGETVVVSGLGMVGLMAVQLLRANGCQVIGVDFDSRRLELARAFGAVTVDLGKGEDAVAIATAATRGNGVDAVLVCVASDSDEPLSVAARMCRKRGRIVLVGVAGLNLVRDEFYKKELSFQVSCSYGPGRYDSAYEEGGRDYPLAFVRWTEQRNFQAVLQLMADGKLNVQPLVTHRFPLARAAEAYQQLSAGGGLGIVFDYDGEDPEPRRVVRPAAAAAAAAAVAVSRAPVFGVLGVGNYASAVLLPAFRHAGARLKTLVSARGLSASHAARRHGADLAATEQASVLDDPEIDAVIIATRHDSHARLVIESLGAGKSVFVEKPLATSEQQLQEIEQALAARPESRLMVGFNRRFAPLVVELQAQLARRPGPRAFVYTVNAGAIPGEHWTQGAEGGGRIIGEACHFIDLLRFLAAAPIRHARAGYARDQGGKAVADVASLNLEFADGSIGTIHYLANGSGAFPKERLEVFAGGGILVLDNFRSLRGFGWPGLRTRRRWRQDKGQLDCARQVVAALQSGAPMPIPLAEIIEVARCTCSLAVELQTLDGS